MRFFLDHDVDAGVASMLRRRGHEAWTASEAGLHNAGDDDLTVYAQDHAAALLTHDKEFSQRRRRNTIGGHVWLHCPEPDAVEVLAARLDDVVRMLDGEDNCYLYVSRGHLDLIRQWK